MNNTPPVRVMWISTPCPDVRPSTIRPMIEGGGGGGEEGGEGGVRVTARRSKLGLWSVVRRVLCR